MAPHASGPKRVKLSGAQNKKRRKEQAKQDEKHRDAMQRCLLQMQARICASTSLSTRPEESIHSLSIVAAVSDAPLVTAEPLDKALAPVRADDGVSAEKTSIAESQGDSETQAEDLDELPVSRNSVDELPLAGSAARHSLPIENARISAPAGRSLSVAPEALSDTLDDVGLWPCPVPHYLRKDLARRSLDKLQHADGPFEQSARLKGRNSGKNKPELRRLGKRWFFITLKNGERVRRITWLAYSPSQKKLFCLCCKLFHGTIPTASDGTFEVRESQLATSGLDSWWKLSEKLHKHEKSLQHKMHYTSWRNLSMNPASNGTIDRQLQLQIDEEAARWRQVLGILLDIILFLAKQNLAFRGHEEKLSAEEGVNCGNFLELVKLMAKHNPVMKDHLDRAVRNPNSPNYLSHTIVDELIQAAAGQVRRTILAEARKAKYYAVLCDTTPDISSHDQMSQVLRYVDIDNGEVNVKEVFVDFVHVKGHKTAEVMCAEIMTKLAADGLSIEDCRAQGYDNASTMAGKESGVQKRISGLNKKAIFVPCSNHSLNLAGVHAARENRLCADFFADLQAIFTFFHGSSNRWEVLLNVTKAALKSSGDTRWSSRREAVDAVAAKFPEIIEALDQLTSYLETPTTRQQARSLKKIMLSFKFVACLEFWKRVLQKVDKVQVYLQNDTLDLDNCARSICDLQAFLSEERTALVEEAISGALRTCEALDIAIETRVVKKKKMPGEQAEDVGLSTVGATRRELLEAMDRLSAEMERRFAYMQDLALFFSFLKPKRLLSKEDDQKLLASIQKAADFYSGDVGTAEEIMEEVKDFRRFEKSRDDRTGDGYLEFLRWIVRWKLEELCPNIVTLLRICLTISVSIATCERSFSKLKLIKNHLRATMGQNRLSDLAILSIENELACRVDFNKFLEDFAGMKARKVDFGCGQKSNGSK